MMTQETRHKLTAWALLLIVIASCLMSCSTPKTVYVQVPGETKTEYIVQTRVDSLVMHDSVYIKEVQKGDTVYITKSEVKYRDKMVIRTDTLERIDTIPAPYPVPEPYPVVEYKMNGIERFFFFIGFLSIISILVYVTLKLWPSWPKQFIKWISSFFH